MPKKKTLDTIRTKVVGVTQTNADGMNRQEIVSRCQVGDALLMLRERDNPADRNAVAVYRVEQIGYLSAELASDIAPVMDEGYHVSAAVLDVTGGGLLKRNRGVNIKLTIERKDD